MFINGKGAKGRSSSGSEGYKMNSARNEESWVAHAREIGVASGMLLGRNIKRSVAPVSRKEPGTSV